MRLAMLFAAGALAILALPAAAQRVNTLPPIVPMMISPAPAAAAATAQSCTTTQQWPDQAKLVTLGAGGPQTTTLAGGDAISTTTICASS
jgi:hypothetical protein